MNNNGGNKSKESDIITKKGFLISLPGKKKDAAEGKSSINLAKPDNEAVKDNNKKDFNKNNKKKHGGKNNRNPDDRRDNKHQNDNKNENRHDHKNDNRHNDGKKNDKGINNHDKQVQKNDPPHNNEQNRDRNDRRDRSRRNDKRNRHGRGDNRNENRSVNQQERNFDKNKEKLQPLSELSSDITGEIKKHAENKPKEVYTPELSLEEKYKNAKPLAEQIAEQEMRQKGIKIPYDTQKAPEESEKQEIVGVRFREAGKIYYFDPAGVKVPFGAPVIVETARGSEYGFTAISNRMIPVESLTAPLKKIERLATAMDTQKHEANKALEKDAEKVFIEKVEKLGLAMNLIYVEYTFDNSRLLFYFTAETRIDFRELVKELASVFRTRIELRQIGVRDEAKMLGGLGVCGRATCCNTFLGDFAQVSIKMAKDQSLSLNAAKISGTCGKLMCCLRYEDKVYEEENARTPKVGSIVETSEGKGVVVERNALKGIVNVLLDLTPEAPAKPFPREEVMVVGFNKDKGDDDLDSEELKHLQDS